MTSCAKGIRRKRMVWSELVPSFLAHVAVYQLPSSQRRYRISIQALRVFDSVPIEKITEERIDDFIQQELKTKAPATVNREVSCLLHGLKIAKRWKWIDRVPEVRKLREPPGRTRFFTPDELRLVMEEMPTWMKPVVLFAVSTGARLNEATSLKWASVKLSEGIAILDTQKNKDLGALYLNSTAQDVLRKIPRVLRQEYVFTRDGHKLGLISHTFKKYAERAGVMNCCFHTLRHTCASWLAMSGVDERTMMQVMRWRSPAMVARYAHLRPQKCKAAVEALETPLSTLRQKSLLVGSEET